MTHAAHGRVRPGRQHTFQHWGFGDGRSGTDRRVATGRHPRREGTDPTITWVDGALLAVDDETVREPAPQPTVSRTPAPTGSAQPSQTASVARDVDQQSLALRWTARSRGLPAVVGTKVLLTTDLGWDIISTTAGQRIRTIELIQPETGRIDVSSSPGGVFVTTVVTDADGDVTALR